MQAGWLRAELFTVGGTSVGVARLATAALIAVVTLTVSWALQRAVVRLLALRGITREGTVGVTRRLTHYFVLAVGFGIVLEVLGIDLSTLFAAGAIFAIGLSFAVQNIAQNFVSGVILLIERSIKPGDVLEVEGRFVRVREMGIRATIGQTLDDEEIIIPNAVIVQSTVKNYTLRDSICRLRAGVGVVYSSDMALVRSTLEAVAGRMDWRNRDKEPVVLMTEFGDSAVIFEISLWIDDPWLMRRSKSELNEAIWWAFKERGIVIAFPQLDVHVDRDLLQAISRPGPGNGEPGRGAR
jgi:small-conductance mechanosensitive channel